MSEVGKSQDTIGNHTFVQHVARLCLVITMQKAFLFQRA